MALTTVSNNALSNITAIPASIPTGALTLIKSITASASASISFVNGTDGVVLDDTYQSYVFKFINVHPATDQAELSFNMSTDTGSNYNVVKTSTAWTAEHREDGSGGGISYYTSKDLAQSTAFQEIGRETANDDDVASSGTLQIFNPSSTVFVKHFISRVNTIYNSSPDYAQDMFVAGYGNTTSAVDGVQFKFASGNIDSGIIKLYGVK